MRIRLSHTLFTRPNRLLLVFFVFFSLGESKLKQKVARKKNFGMQLYFLVFCGRMNIKLDSP